MKFVKNDGGRAEAGYLGTTGDCVTRAIAIATAQPYAKVYAAINQLAKSERLGKRKRRKSSARTGVFKPTYKKYLASLGWEWTPTMQIGSGCTVHLKKGELPTEGTLIVTVSKHLTTVINGVIHDTHDPSRGGTRCVYGYWRKPAALVRKERDARLKTVPPPIKLTYAQAERVRADRHELAAWRAWACETFNISNLLNDAQMRAATLQVLRRRGL